MAKRPTPPGPKSRYPLDAVFQVRRDKLAFFEKMATFGDISSVGVAGTQFYFLNSPDMVKELFAIHPSALTHSQQMKRMQSVLGDGLLTSEGELHKRQRRIMQPAFHKQRIQNYADTTRECTQEVLRRWKSGQTIDVLEEMSLLTTQVVARALFGVEVKEEARELESLFHDIAEIFFDSTLPGVELISQLPLPKYRKLRRAKQRLYSVLDALIHARAQEKEDRGDLFSMVLSLRDTDGSAMSHEQLRDEVLTLFAAGHSTVSAALTWTAYLLALHPDVETKLAAEVTSGREYAELPYTLAVFSESMRMYPPVWAMGRRTTTEVQVAGYTLPKGSYLLASQWVNHRDARNFPEPATFNPDRWTPAAKATRPRFSYFPFGAGSRQCMGEGFAWMQGVLVTAAIFRDWKMTLAPGQTVVPHPLVVLRPRDGMKMILERR